MNYSSGCSWGYIAAVHTVEKIAVHRVEKVFENKCMKLQKYQGKKMRLTITDKVREIPLNNDCCSCQIISNA